MSTIFTLTVVEDDIPVEVIEEIINELEDAVNKRDLDLEDCYAE